MRVMGWSCVFHLLKEFNFSSQSSNLILTGSIYGSLKESYDNSASHKPGELEMSGGNYRPDLLSNSLTEQNVSRSVISKLVDRILYTISRIALAAVKILRAEMHPDCRTSAWGSWRAMVALQNTSMVVIKPQNHESYTRGIRHAV